MRLNWMEDRIELIADSPGSSQALYDLYVNLRTRGLDVTAGAGLGETDRSRPDLLDLQQRLKSLEAKMVIIENRLGILLDHAIGKDVGAGDET